MSKHTKLALFVAPFLIIIGFIASDIWLEQQAGQAKVYVLQAVGGCELVNKQCQLASGDLKINVYDEGGITWVNATFALDSAVLFLVDENDKPTAYPLGMSDNPFYWSSKTPLASLLKNPGDSYKLRVIAAIKGGRYVGEFVMVKS